MAAQWLGLGAFTAVGLGSIPGQGTKIPQAARCGQNVKKKKRRRRSRNVQWMDQWKRGRAPELLYQTPRGRKAASFSRNHTKPRTVGEVVTRITLL